MGEEGVPGDESGEVLLLMCSLTIIHSFRRQLAGPCPLTPALGAPSTADGISLIDCGGHRDWAEGKARSQTQVCGSGAHALLDTSHLWKKYSCSALGLLPSSSEAGFWDDFLVEVHAGHSPDLFSAYPSLFCARRLTPWTASPGRL